MKKYELNYFLHIVKETIFKRKRHIINSQKKFTTDCLLDNEAGGFKKFKWIF